MEAKLKFGGTAIDVSVHDAPAQVQVAQEPELGPTQVPAPHVPVAGHQPQLRTAVQLVQSRYAAQLILREAGAATHCVRLHAQFEHVLPAGPSHVPDWHLPLLWQNPQPVAPVQSPHSVNDSQLPHFWLGPNCQAAHAWPLAGPAVDPASHLLVAGHQPHPDT